MNKAVRDYIDRCLVDDYADKKAVDGYGYALDVSDIENNDKSHFLDLLLIHDEAMQDLVQSRMQEIIDERLNQLDLERRHELGLVGIVDQVNGETRWRKYA